MSIKLAHPFPAPELQTRILRTRGFFWLICLPRRNFNGSKNSQKKSPPKIHPEILLEEFPSDLHMSLFLTVRCGFVQTQTPTNIAGFRNSGLSSICEPGLLWIVWTAIEKLRVCVARFLVTEKFGNGPNTVSGSTVFKHRTQWVFRGSLSSGERTQWVPFSLLFVCKRELTEFFAELTEFAPKLSEAQWVPFSETVLRPFPKSVEQTHKHIGTACLQSEIGPECFFFYWTRKRFEKLEKKIRKVLNKHINI